MLQVKKLGHGMFSVYDIFNEFMTAVFNSALFITIGEIKIVPYFFIRIIYGPEQALAFNAGRDIYAY